MYYDYTIIGGGPSGIYCADKLSQLGHKVCLIETLEALGGCHRVRYVKDDEGNMIHTEHGPRIYLGCYLDFWNWIKEIDIIRDDDFTKYITSALGNDIINYSLQFKLYELIVLVIAYIIQNILRIDFSQEYTVDDLMDNTHFTDEGKKRLNRICRLIDGGNTDKTNVISLFKGLDVGLAYSIYEPKKPMDTLIWNKFYDKLISQNVEIMLNTNVLEITNHKVISNNGIINTENILLCIPPFAINTIKNAPSLCGYDPLSFDSLAKNQQYEPYVCATLEFKNKSSLTRWGIADEHPWGLIDIDMGRYFEDKNGSLFIVSITHPEKIDPKTKKTANEMEKNEFLDRIVELVKERFNIIDDPILKSFSPNVQKINGGWIETDRAFLHSPPGWLKPNFDISKKNKVFTTGHHLGNSYHDYNSMESAIQNASTLLSNIEPNYNYKISKPWSLSSIIHLVLSLVLLIIVFYYIYINRKISLKKMYIKLYKIWKKK